MSKIREYIKALPSRYGFNEAYSYVADWVFSRELEGDKIFNQENFENCEERAALLIPCRLDSATYNHELKVLTYAIMKHRAICHNEDYNDDIERLAKDLSEEEKRLIGPTGFWGGDD